jgi:transcription elongation factor SPT6
LLRLGKTLTIDNETFEDLDEVGAPEKAENPMRIVYSFGISHEHPGTIILSYIRGTNPHHEYVGLYPKVFRFRKTDFDNIDHLVSYFQKNIDKRQPDAEPSMRNVAAMVPMKNSAWGSGGGADDANDGYRDRPLSGRSGQFHYDNL